MINYQAYKEIDISILINNLEEISTYFMTISEIIKINRL